jgi:hypothetical protein
MASIPHINDDPIARLSAHYFGTADLMRLNFERLDARRKSGKRLSRAMKYDWNQYLKIWLGFLYVAVEGFLELRISPTMTSRGGQFESLASIAQRIEQAITIHQDSLRLYRNGTFHYQRDPEKFLQFIVNNERLNWAKSLHEDFKAFFSGYRVARTVTWALEENEFEKS